MQNTKTKMNLKSKRKRGFTLIELMVVLAVIAVITAIAVPNFTSIKDSVNVKVDKQTCETIKSITRTFVADGSIKLTNGDQKLIYDANTGEISGGTINGEQYKDALSEVKPPQIDSTKPYEITITSKGNVKVMVDGVADTSTEVAKKE